MELKFRPLRADEVECRVGQVKQGSGLSLLLYKDARCDMNILDETVGPMHWQRQHSRDNANCTVSIWDEDTSRWVYKEDTGTESNTEAEKGKASDSFKRACFNWGIGRELYTAPFIWVKGGEKYDKYEVAEMEVTDYRITRLVIRNQKTGATAYTWSDRKRQQSVQPLTLNLPPQEDVTAHKQRLWSAVKAYCAKTGNDPLKVIQDVRNEPGYQETAAGLQKMARKYEEMANA